MAGTRICSIVGRKDAGKTTLAVALSSEFARRKRRVMTIKHATHAAQMDTPGTDSYRHFHEGKSERVVLACPEQRYIMEQSKDDLDPVTLAKRYLDGADIFLVLNQRWDAPSLGLRTVRERQAILKLTYLMAV